MDPKDSVKVVVDGVVHTTQKAALCEIGGKQHWLPFSQMRGEIEEAGDCGDLLIPRWLADDKGLGYKEVGDGER